MSSSSTDGCFGVSTMTVMTPLPSRFRGGHRPSGFFHQTSSLVFSSLFPNFFSSLLWNILCSLFVNIHLMFVMFLCRISDEISLILHHNGKFIQNENGVLEYVDGEFCVREEIEIDLVNVWTP